MRGNLLKLLFSIGACSLVHTSVAATFTVEVTQLAGNIFRVDDQRFVVETRGCPMPSVRDRAVLNSTGSGGTLKFIAPNFSCPVRAVYAQVEIKSGAYSVYATHESDQWYSLDSGYFVLTDLCYQYRYHEKSVLSLRPNGSGVLDFSGATAPCTILGTYRKALL